MKREMSETVLGFNPYSQNIEVSVVDITPEIAEYILAFHNNDNRKIIRSQVNKIRESIRNDGWLEDGQPLTFNTEGNITEAQHRLEAIVAEQVTAKMVVVLGVRPNCFTQCAPAKPRRADDEIQRKDKTATPSEISTLRQLLVRRQGEKLSINNAVDLWEQWKEVVREGRNLVDDFFDAVTEFNPWERTFAAWASLMIYVDKRDVAEQLLDLLKSEILDDGTTCLTSDFLTYFKEETIFLPAAARTEAIYQLLCVASDRIEKVFTGRVQLAVSSGNMNHKYLSQKGFYRQFLDSSAIN